MLKHFIYDESFRSKIIADTKGFLRDDIEAQDQKPVRNDLDTFAYVSVRLLGNCVRKEPSQSKCRGRVEFSLNSRREGILPSLLYLWQVNFIHSDSSVCRGIIEKGEVLALIYQLSQSLLSEGEAELTDVI